MKLSSNPSTAKKKKDCHTEWPTDYKMYPPNFVNLVCGKMKGLKISWKTASLPEPNSAARRLKQSEKRG
jgi:hypothetical protein